MKGSAVAVIFIVINIIAATIFMTVITVSIKKSIISEEELSKASLNKIIEVYSNKNIASINYYNAISLIPRLDIYTLNSLSNYIRRINLIHADNSLIEKPITFQEFQYIQARIQENINKINYTARNYPVLRTNEGYIKALYYIKPIIKDETKAIEIYNSHVKEYNKLTSMPPSSIIAGIMGKFPFLTFETGTNIISQTARMFE